MLIFAASAVFGVIGGLLIGLAASQAVTDDSPVYRPVVVPGPRGMESRVHYRHLGDVVDARRQISRELDDEALEMIRNSVA